AGADEAPVNATCERLIALGADVAAIPEPAPDGPALSRIRSALFTPPLEPLAPDGTLQLVSAPDPSREVRAAARACLAWAEEGVEFWEMALAYRQGDAYRPLVEAVFAEAKIPLYMHEGSPVAERPVGRQTLALLALFESNL